MDIMDEESEGFPCPDLMYLVGCSMDSSLSWWCHCIGRFIVMVYLWFLLSRS